jgi:hypothetical protein
MDLFVSVRDGSQWLLPRPWRSRHPSPPSSPRARARCTRRWCGAAELAHGSWITATGNLPISITTSAPARTRASTSAKLLTASASEMWITWSAMARLHRHFSSWKPVHQDGELRRFPVRLESNSAVTPCSITARLVHCLDNRS